MTPWYFILPLATLNLITNPSFERGATGWATAGSNTIARSSEAQFRGNYSGKATYQNNTTLASFALTLPATNATYYLTAWLYVPADWNGGDLRLTTQSINGATHGYNRIFTAGVDDTARWLRLETAVTVTSDTTGSIALETTGAPTPGRAVYLDAVQLEQQSDTSTTYCDGDQDGCKWSGAAHASTSSRPATTRAGGRIVNLEADYGALVQNEVGTGAAHVRNVTMQRAIVPGSEFQRSTADARTMALVLNMVGDSRADLGAQRRALIRGIAPASVPGDQPVLWQFTGAEQTKQIAARYDGGMELRGPNVFGETFTLRLLATEPFWTAEPEAAVNMGTSQAEMELIAARIAGEWTTFGPPHAGGTYGAIHSIAVAHSGLFWLAGDFENFDNNAAADYIVQYQEGWEPVFLGGPNGDVLALHYGVDGNLYMVGAFTAIGGNSAYAYIAYWDGSSLNALGTPASGATITRVNAVAIHPLTGDVYVGGLFANLAGIAAADNIAYFDVSAGTWQALGSGTNGEVLTLTFDPAGNLYAGGAFTTAGGIVVNRVATFTAGGSWGSMGGGFSSGQTNTLTISPAGTLYAGGNWTTTTPGLTVNRVASWTGSGWRPLGQGMNGAVLSLVVSSGGTVYALGNFNVAGGNTLADGLAYWGGGDWRPLPIDLPGAVTRGTLAIHGDDLYIGTDQSGTAYFSDLTTVTNAGTEAAGVRLDLIHDGTGGPVVIEQIENVTTGRRLYFRPGYTILPGDHVTLDLRVGRIKAYRAGQAGIGWPLAPGSDTTSFALAPGDNELAFYASPSNPANLEIFIRWQDTFTSLD